MATPPSTLPPMYNEEVAMKLEQLAQERNVRPLIVVEEAIASFGENQLIVEQVKRQYQEEMQVTVSEMRVEHIQMQRKLLTRDARIAELEQREFAGGSFPQQHRELAQTPVPVPVEHNFSSWLEFADTVVCNRTELINTVKKWSLQERQSLSALLAEYLGEEQDALDLVTWVPDKLLHSALSKLSFCVSKISGPDNMIDEPEIEEISGCRFVSVQHLGIRRPSGDARRLATADARRLATASLTLSPVATLGARVCRGKLPPATPLQSPRPHWTHREQWIFEGYGGRKLSVFGRDEFKIERYQN